MRKLVSMAAVAVLCSTSALFAEVSGGFIGIGIGGGGTALKAKGDGFNEKQTRSGLNYGFVGGYKQFFNDYLGLRYYVNVDLHHNMSKVSGETEAYKVIVANYGVNVDFLGNFVSNESLDFGGFVGLGLGANTLTGKDIEDAKKLDSTMKTTGFDIALNVGLRTNIATNHGVEVAVRVPFLPVTMWNEGGIKTTFGQEYSVLARYTFSF